MKLDELAPELLVMIFKQLASRTDLYSVNLVCKAFYELINHRDYCRLWLDLPPEQHQYCHPVSKFDFSSSHLDLYELSNGDVVIAYESGEFYLLPPHRCDPQYFIGHSDVQDVSNKMIRWVTFLYHNRLATCAADGIRIWDRSGKLLTHLPLLEEVDKPFCLRQATRGELVSVSVVGDIHVYDNTTWKVIAKMTHDYVDPGDVIFANFFGEEFVVEFDRVVIRWNKYGRAAHVICVKEDLHRQLCEQLQAKHADDLMQETNWEKI